MSESNLQGPVDGDILERRKLLLMEQIENILLLQIEYVSSLKPLILTIRNQRNWNNVTVTDTVKLNPLETALMTEVKFRKSSSQSKFTRIVHTLGKIYRLLSTNSTCTVRELYYQDVAIYEHQRHADSSLRAICCLLDAAAWELGVISTSKGLIAGPLIITTDNQEIIDCSNTQGGVLIPQKIQDIVSLKTSAKLIIIIEKDAVFQKLLDEGVLERFKHCLLITGKGYPDSNTRRLLQRLWRELHLPTYALVDADPHGIDIMCVYRFGSLAMATQADSLATPALRWLGILPSDIALYSAKSLPLSTADHSKIRQLLARPYIRDNVAIRKELEVLETLGRKAEIEGIAGISQAYLTDVYLPDKLKHKDYI